MCIYGATLLRLQRPKRWKISIHIEINKILKQYQCCFFFHCWTSKSAWVTYWVLSPSRVNNNTPPPSTETTRGFRYSIINKIVIIIIKQTQLFINFINNKTTLLVRMRKTYSQNWNIKKKNCWMSWNWNFGILVLLTEFSRHK